MDTIDKHNYEAFYLDYIEGNLDAEATAQLLLFLEINPKLKATLDDFELVTLEASAVTLSNKSSLKHEINEQTIDDFIIADIEAILPTEDQLELATFVKSNAENKKLYNRYNKTKLVPPEVHFQNKEKLKKRGAVIYYLIPTAVAAALLLLFLSWPKTPISDSDTIRLVEVPLDKKDSKGQSLRRDKPATKNQNIEDVVSTQNDDQRQQIHFTIETTTTTETFTSENRLFVSLEDSGSTLAHDKIVNSKEQELDTIQNTDLHMGIDNELKPHRNISAIASTDNETLTIKEWLNKTIRKKLLRNGNISAQRIESNELLAAVSERLDNGTKTDISYNYGQKTEQQREFFRIKIGKFEFYRTKRK